MTNRVTCLLVLFLSLSCLGWAEGSSSVPLPSSQPAPTWKSVDELLMRLETEATLSASESKQLVERLKLVQSMLSASQTEVSALSLSLARSETLLKSSEMERAKYQRRSSILGWTTAGAAVVAAALVFVIVIR